MSYLRIFWDNIKNRLCKTIQNLLSENAKVGSNMNFGFSNFQVYTPKKKRGWKKQVENTLFFSTELTVHFLIFRKWTVHFSNFEKWIVYFSNLRKWTFYFLKFDKSIEKKEAANLYFSTSFFFGVKIEKSRRKHNFCPTSEFYERRLIC